MRVVKRCHRAPLAVDVPRGGEQVVALPKVIGGLVPQGTVRHRVAFGDVLAISSAGEVAVFVVGEHLVERVVAAETGVPHVLIGLDASLCAVGAVH